MTEAEQTVKEAEEVAEKAEKTSFPLSSEY